MRDPRERLRDMLEAIEHIERYASRGRDTFERDELIQNWIVRHLQIIGEAARAMPQEVRERATNIPWSKIIGSVAMSIQDRPGRGGRRRHTDPAAWPRPQRAAAPASGHG